MGRLPRLHVPGGYYHVMLRGNHRQDLFATDADRLKLNNIVAGVTESCGARSHAFCWMSNHLHLLIQIGDRPLGKVMQRIAMRYSRYRHRQLRTTGHLFERRYRAKLVDVDDYVIALLRYIHRNPVVAGMVKDPADYPWSSHRAYLGLQTLPWLTTDVALGLFGSTAIAARDAYARWMAQESYASEERLWDEAHPDDARVLGGDRFLSALPPFKIVPRSAETLEQLAQRICVASGISLEHIRSSSRTRKLTAVRLAIAVDAINNRVATIAQVAAYFGRDASGVSKLLQRRSLS
jgi:putative transposase